jgi:hypothetical protein
LKPVVQMIWSTVNVSPSATATKSRMITIWFAWEAVHTPSTWRAIVEEI